MGMYPSTYTVSGCVLWWGILNKERAECESHHRGVSEHELTESKHTVARWRKVYCSTILTTQILPIHTTLQHQDAITLNSIRSPSSLALGPRPHTLTLAHTLLTLSYTLLALTHYPHFPQAKYLCQSHKPMIHLTEMAVAVGRAYLPTTTSDGSNLR